MKGFLAVLLVFGSVSAALSAQMPQLSAGLGGNFTADWTTYTLTQSMKDADQKAEDFNSHLVGGGFYAFFDAVYAEATIGFLFGSYAGDSNSDTTAAISTLKLGLFGKFPIDLGAFTIFPMLGIDGQIFLGGKAQGKEPGVDIFGNTIENSYERDISTSDGQDMMTQLWFKAGVGFDIPLPALEGKLFLRPEALYGVRLNTKAEQDTLKSITTAHEIFNPFYDFSDPNSPLTIIETRTHSAPFSAIVGHGMDIRISIGYKF